jgi:peroxiredoxin Q/BCP
LNRRPAEVNLTRAAQECPVSHIADESGPNEDEMVANLDIGAAAPDFALASDDGGSIRLADLRGRIVVLFFYPKDDTTGCTAEAVAFNQLLPRFKKAGATLLGVSPDGVKSHAAFKRKHELSLTLLADPEHKALEAYDVWREKSMYGRKYMGVERTTAIVGPDGRLAHLWRRVKVPGHAEETLAAVKALSATFAKH